METLIVGNGVTIRVVKGGNIVIEKDGETKMITSNGYTIVYRDQ